jgi:Family of unknown function (DUF6194)
VALSLETASKRRHLVNQDDIRDYLGAMDRVSVVVSAPGDGSPEVAWGDTFFFARDEHGESKKMPFATIVIKDYEGFDSYSKLNRGSLYRLNIEIGKEKFEELLGFKPKELEANRNSFDFTALNQLFPHPFYGTHGWVSIINPSGDSRELVTALLDFSSKRAISRAKI